MKYERKGFAFQVKEIGEDGEVEGYASVFGIRDKGGDTMMRGAFRSCEGKSVPMLWQHDAHQPIGVWSDVREDERGLHVKGRIVLETAKGREAKALMEADAMKGLSIGYITKDYERDGNGRKLTDVELMEVSAVTFPMLPAAEITSIKSDATIRDWEGFLRDAGGLSRKEAKAFCAGGFKALAALRDGADEGDELGEFLALVRNFGR